MKHWIQLLVNVIMILEIRNLWILFVIQIFLLLNGWMKNQRQKWKFYQVSCPMNSWRASLWGLTLSLTQYVEPSDPRLMLQAGTMVLSFFYNYWKHTRIFTYVLMIASKMSLNKLLTFFCTLLNFQSVLTKAMCLPCPPSLCSVNWTLTVTK